MTLNPGKQFDCFNVKTNPDKRVSLSHNYYYYCIITYIIISFKPRFGGLIINQNTKIVCIYPELNISTVWNQKHGIA